jgi:hypothetical protein
MQKTIDMVVRGTKIALASALVAACVGCGGGKSEQDYVTLKGEVVGSMQTGYNRTPAAVINVNGKLVFADCYHFGDQQKISCMLDAAKMNPTNKTVELKGQYVNDTDFNFTGIIYGGLKVE